MRRAFWVPAVLTPLIALFLNLLSQASRLVRWIVSLAVFYLVVMTLLRLGTYLVFSQQQMVAGQVWPALWLGWRFDVRVVATAMLPLLVLGSFSIFDPFRTLWTKRLWHTLLAVFGLGLVIFYVSDYLHYRYVGQRLNASVLAFLGDARISAGMVWQSYPVGQIVLVALVVTVGLVMAVSSLYWRAATHSRVPPRLGRVLWFTAVLGGCIVGIFGRVGQYPLRWSDAFALGSEASANLALNPVESFVSSLSFRTTGYDQDKVREHAARITDYLGSARTTRDQPPAFERLIPAVAGPNSPAKRRPNVVLVICESFSGYKSSMWGNPLDTTPFFNSLVREGVFFDNCFTPHFGTARGVWATLTGIPDVSEVETASRNPAMVDQHTIIDDFAGYEKLYFLGGSSSWANIRGLLTNNIQGLKLYEEGSYKSPRVDVWGISDKSLFHEADQVLRTQTEPFFAVIQTADNHRPYTIPKDDLAEFKVVDVPDDQLKKQGFESLAELNAFRYTDFAFQKFFEAARQSPYFDNTLFVFIGDHGIGGQAGPEFPAAWTANSLTRFHVPLLFYAPKLLRPQRVHAVASQVDVLPTIAGLANIAYRNTAFGRDLLRQQQVDGGASNQAFIIDHNDKTIGVVKQSYYGVERPRGGRHEVVWADFAAPPAPAADAIAEDYRASAQAFYETARYLLLNNPKSAARAGATAVSSLSHPP
ncbi:MAG: sulfatase-like hydrolase/transferase [Opitutaceae bacterium]